MKSRLAFTFFCLLANSAIQSMAPKIPRLRTKTKEVFSIRREAKAINVRIDTNQLKSKYTGPNFFKKKFASLNIRSVANAVSIGVCSIATAKGIMTSDFYLSIFPAMQAGYALFNLKSSPNDQKVITEIDRAKKFILDDQLKQQIQVDQYKRLRDMVIFQMDDIYYPKVAKCFVSMTYTLLVFGGLLDGTSFEKILAGTTIGANGLNAFADVKIWGKAVGALNLAAREKEEEDPTTQQKRADEQVYNKLLNELQDSTLSQKELSNNGHQTVNLLRQS